MMRTSHDPEAEAFYVRFAPDPVEITSAEEVVPGVMIDLDADGDVVGIQVLSVSRCGRKAMERATVKPAAAE